jgi:branched-chain amino acid transport system substrate-binding protein
MKKWAGAFIIGLLIMAGAGFSGDALAQAKKTPIKIGVVADKTGGLAAYGYSHEKTIRAAVAKINRDGGISGRQVELYVEDTESKPSVGALKFRKLVETYGVDFVLDSNSSGVAVACAPVAKELKVIYMPSADASELWGDKGNRYVFPACSSVSQETKAAARYAVKNIGKKWVTVVVNYAWGWANEQEFTRFIKQDGGTVLASIRVPLGTSDWLPYLKGKLPKEAEAVYFANFGSDFLSFIRDLYAVRPDVKKLGAVYALSGQDIKKLGPAAEGAYCMTPYPTMLEGLTTKSNKAFRELINVDPEGKEIGTGVRFVLAFNWAMWEAPFELKAAIEKSGWQGKQDTPKLIQALEGMSFKNDVEFPLGDLTIRAEDHLPSVGMYVERIVNGDLKVVSHVPAADVTYPPLVNHSKEGF